MVAIKGKIVSNRLWEKLPYGSVKLQLFSLTYNGKDCHNCDYSIDTTFLQEIPIVEIIYSTKNEVSLIKELQPSNNPKEPNIIEVECANKFFYKPEYLVNIKEVSNGQIKFYNLCISEKEIYVEGKPCPTIASVTYNPENKYKHNWVKSTKEFVSKLVKLPEIPNSLIPAKLDIQTTSATQESATQESATQESATQELVNV